jgi:hypothetical protein
MVVEEWASILLYLWVTFGHQRHDNIKMMLTHPANTIESEMVYISLVFMQKLNNFHQPITSQACTCGHIELQIKSKLDQMHLEVHGSMQLLHRRN